MSDLVDPAQIEEIVGVERDKEIHYGRAVSADKTVYILHSRRCVNSEIDLRTCEYSVALDKGLLAKDWRDFVDVPVALEIKEGRLVPASKAVTTSSE